MKTLFALKSSIALSVLLLAAACSPAAEAPAPAPAVEDAAPAAPPEPPTPPADAAPAIPAQLIGRWGVTVEACAPTNDARDGVIAITTTTVDMGLDACTISGIVNDNGQVTLTTQCLSGEGEDYQRDVSFVSSTPETMTWITEGGAAEPYVRCL